MKKNILSVTGPFFVAALGALMAFTSLSTDIYLPAMPVMSADLQGNAGLTVTGFLIGFSIGQLVWGPVSDRIGRRMPLLLGMIIFVAGSVGCALSPHIADIIFWRVFQALGACTGPMLARAMIRDLFARTRAVQMLSTLVMISAVAPIIGPLLGGQILLVSSWRAVFWLLAAVGCGMFFILLWLPETLAQDNRLKTPISAAFENYRLLIRNNAFLRYTLCVTFYYVAAYAFIVGSPFVYINFYKVEPGYYGWFFAINIIGVVVMSAVNRRLVQHYDLSLLLKVSATIAMSSTLILAFGIRYHDSALILIVITVFIFFSMNGIIAASCTAAALDCVPASLAGSASAFIGSLQYGSGIISSLLLAWMNDETPGPMSWIMFLFTVMCFVTLILPGKKKAVSV